MQPFNFFSLACLKFFSYITNGKQCLVQFHKGKQTI